VRFFNRRKSDYAAGLPILPDAVNDNMYLAAASKAAELDKSSGAYDHFLFEEKALKQMPFERAVDTHLGLVSLRLEDRGRREVLKLQKETLAGKARVEIAQMRTDRLSKQIENLEDRLEKQKSILRAEEPGRHGLFWPGVVPEVTTQPTGFIKVLIPYIVFILVGIVDVGIVYISLNNLPGFDNWEPVLFSAPVIGVQLIFPHLIGQRLSLISRGSKQTIRNSLEIVIFAIIWLTFAVSLTAIRMSYIEKLASDDGQPLDDTLYYLLWVTNLLMLVGLGSWLLFLESRRNHHEHDALRILLRMGTLSRIRQNASTKLEVAKSAVPSLELAESVAIASYEDAVRASGSALAEAAKSVYRRSLVNQIGTPEFTSSYISSENSKKD
jgi:hypothetical protein